MTERTVTEQQVIDVFNKPLPQDERIYLNAIFEKLFPELPKAKELVLCWNGAIDEGEWRKFFSFDADGNILTKNEYGDHCEWENYRRQTPAERGEAND
jgi:hypothetical protein